MDVWITVKEKKKNAELRELLLLDAVSLITERFGYIEHKDDTDWIKCWKWKELHQGDVRGRHGGMVSRRILKDFGLSREGAQSWGKWRKKIKGAPGS